MLTSLDALTKAYYDTIEDSRKKCPSEIEEIRKFVLDLSSLFHRTHLEILREMTSQRKDVSLSDLCYAESMRSSAHIVFLSTAGLYRNAYDCIRHMLESIIQATYLDTRHSDIDIDTKIAILKEVEDKFEYHALRLIDDLDIGFKDKLKHEYRELSRIIHPSHKQIVAILTHLTSKPDSFHVVPPDCEEVSRICSSVKRAYDIFFYLYTVSHPEIISLLKKNSEFLNVVKRFKLPLLASSLGVKLK